jgi:hypothetical protein
MKKGSPAVVLVARLQNYVCVRLVDSSLKRPKVSSGVDRAAGAIASRNAIFVIRPDQMRFFASGLAEGYGVGIHEYRHNIMPVRLAQQ